MRTVVLDDDRIFLAVAESYLAALGVSDIQTTTDPVEASDILHNEEIDLVVLDLNMPEKDGLSFLRSMSEIGFQGAVIIVSGEKSSIVSSSSYIADKLGLNVCGALAKPLDMKHLQRAFECANSSFMDKLSASPVAKLLPHGTLKPVLYYQPQIEAATGKLLGAEALMRGVDDSGNIFSPVDVLNMHRSVEERFTLTTQLLELLCADIVELRQSGFTNRFAFNVDATCLEEPQFVELIIGTVTKFGLSPADIVIELIESHLPTDETWLLETIARLSIAGFEVAMDDFSTGAASFDLLRSGAFSQIKLDTNLVLKSRNDAASAKFVANATQIAEALDIKIVAEGVESEDDVNRMLAMGIDCVQGFYIAKPADKSRLLKNYPLADEGDRLAS